MKKYYSIFLFSLLLLAGSRIAAQIAIAPSFVFIDEKSGVGNLFVSNNGQKSQEISISFMFGYPGSDAEGNLVMVYDDSTAFARFALDSMIRAFPRSFILKGGEQRTVRIQIIPTARKKEGYYYTRMKVLAKPLAAEVADTLNPGISTRISFNFEQVTAVFYHKGAVNTGLEVLGTQYEQADTQLRIIADLKHKGNSPYLGSMFARLIDEKGKTVAESQVTTTAYFDVKRSITVNTAGIAPGSYKLELSFETRRNDMMASDLVQAERMVYESTIVLH
jgi:hypothetical protein